MKQKIVIRVDSGPSIGVGHAMRMLALAEACSGVAEPIFASSVTSPLVSARLRQSDFTQHVVLSPIGSSEDAEETASLVNEVGADWLVLDGYRFDDPFRTRVARGNHSLCMIDDGGGADTSAVDLVVNQNAYAKAEMYDCPEERVLAGASFAMLRSEFLRTKHRVRDGSLHKVLVTLGGGDTASDTSSVITSLEDLPLEVRALRGESDNMPELMNWADVALSAAGSTCWELAFMGVPAMVVARAQNQMPVAKVLEQLGVALRLPDLEGRSLLAGLSSMDPRHLVSMSKCGRELIDGKGAKRVVAELIRLRVPSRS